MTGAEVATIAAAESKNPERAVAKAANSVIVRIAIFYVGSMFLLVTIVPWNDETIAASPYVAAFTQDGHSVRRQRDERRGADRRAQLSELGHVHRLADAVRPGGPPRGAATIRSG